MRLPTGWQWTSLEELIGDEAPIVYGIIQAGPEVANGIPYVRPTELVDGRIDISSLKRTSAAIANKYSRSMLKTGDIVLAIVGTIGKLAIVPPELEGANITQSSARLRPPSFMPPSYLSAVLQSPQLREQFDQMEFGVAVRRLNIAHVRALRVPLAPANEQRRIVAKLDAIFDQTRASKARLERLSVLLENLKRSILAAAFDGDLTADWRSARHVQPGERVALSEVCASSFYGPRFGKDEYATDGVPTIRTTDMTDDGRIVLTPETPRVRIPQQKLEQFRVRRGDLLVTRTGSIGVMAVFDENYIAVPSAYLIRFRFLPLVEPRYVFFCLMSPEGQEHLGLSSTAVTQPNINAEAIKRITIPIPNLEEQREIIRRVDDALARVAALEARTRQLADQLLKFEAAALAKAFRGELVDQDPADEPVSVLLDRIRAAGQASATNGTKNTVANANRRGTKARATAVRTES